jgi:tRNA-dependent cyclodipeptide synthase
MPRVRIKFKTFSGRKADHDARGRAFVGISLNNHTMGSEQALKQILEWTIHNVGAFDLLIGDYLNRFNYQAFDNDPEALAVEKAMRDGDEARKKLSPLISVPGLYATVDLISAANFCNQPAFHERRAHFEQMHAANSEFRGLIEEGVKSYLKRKFPKVSLDEHVRRFCVAYQLEELVMFEALAQQGYDTFVYPGGQLPVMKSIVSGSLPKISSAIERLTLVELRLFGETQ